MFRCLLLACLLPSLSSAWCSNSRGIVGGVVRCVASKQPPLHLLGHSSSPVTGNNYLHPHFQLQNKKSCRNRNVERLKLWSVANGAGGSGRGGEDVDTAAAAGGEEMTLDKASKLISTFWSMAYPYYQESQPGRRLFYGMILLTLVNSGVSVAFSYISKDFWNALSSKDTAEFYSMMIKYGGALVVGAPVAVLYR